VVITWRCGWSAGVGKRSQASVGSEKGGGEARASASLL
jgi:hypothetical protein